MSNAFSDMADRLDALADNLTAGLKEGLRLFGLAMVEYLEEHSPRDTGEFAEGWQLEDDGDGYVLTSPASYGSFIHEPGDESKTPIYPRLIEEAVAYAAEQVNMNTVLIDITAAYIGKGWKLSPTNAIWLELTGRVDEGFADSRPVLPTINVPAAQAGSIRASDAKKKRK